MPKFAANLTMMFSEYEPLERFERAAEAGFKFVEYLFPYAFYDPGHSVVDFRKSNCQVSHIGNEGVLGHVDAKSYGEGGGAPGHSTKQNVL